MPFPRGHTRYTYMQVPDECVPPIFFPAYVTDLDLFVVSEIVSSELFFSNYTSKYYCRKNLNAGC